MIEAIFMIVKEWTFRRSASARENHHESLIDEMLRERAAVLSRAGFAVEEALEKLIAIDRQLEEKILYWQCRDHDVPDGQPDFEEINGLVDQFNTARQKAEVQYYYLIVTREALGLRRHETVQKLYQIPPKKKKIQAV